MICQALTPAMGKRGRRTIAKVAFDSAFGAIPGEGMYGAPWRRLFGYPKNSLSAWGTREFASFRWLQATCACGSRIFAWSDALAQHQAGDNLHYAWWNRTIIGNRGRCSDFVSDPEKSVEATVWSSNVALLRAYLRELKDPPRRDRSVQIAHALLSYAPLSRLDVEQPGRNTFRRAAAARSGQPRPTRIDHQRNVVMAGNRDE